ncbi:MAG: nucleotidyltransferase domain-containing protein [Thermodesulfobacteriota bacterium]
MKQKAFFLNQKQKKQLMRALEDALRDREEIVFAYLYGSFAEDLPSHDMDVGIFLSGIKEEESTSYGLALSQELSEKVQVPVDVRVLNFAPVLFVYHVIRGNLIFDRSEEIRVHVIEETVQKYLDLKPMIHKSIKEAFGV